MKVRNNNRLSQKEISRLSAWMYANRDFVSGSIPSEVASKASEEFGFVVTKDNVANMADDIGLPILPEKNTKTNRGLFVGRIRALEEEVAMLKQKTKDLSGAYDNLLQEMALLEGQLAANNTAIQKLNQLAGSKILS